MMRVQHKLAATGLAAAAAMLCGCTQARVDPLMPPDPPIVWPKPPESAHVRYLGTISGSRDIQPRKTLAEAWDEFFHGPELPSVFVGPYAVAVHADGRRVAVADTQRRCVDVFDLEGRTYEEIHSCGAPAEEFECPVAARWIGEVLWVADSEKHAIAIIDRRGSSRWIGRDDLQRPAGLAWCEANNLCYVSDAKAHAVIAYNEEGKRVFQFGSHGAGPGQFNAPTHLTCALDGTLFVADSLNFRIQCFAPDGTFMKMWGRKGDAAGDLSLPKGVATDAQGNLWVVDAHFENIQAFKPDGTLLMALGREGSDAGEFWLPAGLCIDGRNRMWVADAGNHRVQVFEIMTP